MFIQTEALPDITRMKFFPGEVVMPSGAIEFADKEAAGKVAAGGTFICN